MNAFSYRTAATSVKLMTTGFLLLAVLGLGVAGLQVYETGGLTTAGTLAHYRGSEDTFQVAMTFAELVAITHAHAFTMPLLALALSGAFVLTEASERAKRIVIALLFAAMVLELALPWAVRYGPAWTVHGFPAAGVLLGTGLFAAVIVPLREMWTPSRRR